MALHFRPTDPLPAPASPNPDLADVCISLNAKQCVDDWWRPREFERNKLCLLEDVNGSSGALSLLVESLSTPQYDRRNTQFADLAYRRSSNLTYYTLSVSTFARSCCTFPRFIRDVVRRVPSRPTRRRYRRFRGMPELLRRFAVYHLALLRELSATGHHHHDRVNLHIMRVRPRAQGTGAPRVRQPVFRSLKSRHCFPRPPTFLIIPGWFPRSASQSDIS